MQAALLAAADVWKPARLWQAVEEVPYEPSYSSLGNSDLGAMVEMLTPLLAGAPSAVCRVGGLHQALH